MTAKLTTLAKQLALAGLMGGLSFAAAAHDLTLAECVEGSDFIMHAAMSRENGMTREDFLARMESDIRLIQAFPPQLRWFVQDEDDERLLTWGARLVFDAPRDPESHQSEFLAACTAHVSATTDADVEAPEEN
jgi:hypothetical protein